jgi:ribosome recycling factor
MSGRADPILEYFLQRIFPVHHNFAGSIEVNPALICYNKITMFDTKPYQSKMESAYEHYEDDLRKVRTGRANPDMLSGVFVEAYGAKVPLNQVANVTVPEPQLLQINPFDPSNVQAISTAIRNDQSLGMNPSDDGRIVRVPVPALTQERRQQLAKQLGEKAEACRIALRVIRQDAFKSAKAQKEAKELSEDAQNGVQKKIDELITDYQNRIDAALKSKESEVLSM